ncbi:uncharacterized protein LOC135079301 [Ostrinia nubilalis]|uniref:uncharacterized protein LOC114353571 n=1 Tax=Ostrinia furnacalis TaxID=93504 RepID=UPI00103CE36F|nr:uncharacterized protein LOC114353571 [Ostrinia furnacalis]
MDPNCHKAIPIDYSEYLEKLAKIDALQKITDSLDMSLAESERAMMELQDMFEYIPEAETRREQPGAAAGANDVKQEDVSNFLDAAAPKLLMADMPESNAEEVDVDDVIQSMRGYAEELRNNFVLPELEAIQAREGTPELDLTQYATALDQLCRRLTRMKLSQRQNQRNPDLDRKLEELCREVEKFCQLVELRTYVSEANRSHVTVQSNSTQHYDNIINRLLSGINEVAYFLQNKN